LLVLVFLWQARTFNSIRELELPSSPRTLEEHVIVHEIGHQGGGGHSDGGIMTPGASLKFHHFAPASIKLFRRNTTF